MKIIPPKGLERGDGTYDHVPTASGYIISWNTFILVKTSKQVTAEELGKELGKRVNHYLFGKDM